MNAQSTRFTHSNRIEPTHHLDRNDPTEARALDWVRRSTGAATRCSPSGSTGIPTVGARSER